MTDVVGSHGIVVTRHSRAIMASVVGSRGTIAASHAGPVMTGVIRSGREQVPGKEHVNVSCVRAAVQVKILRRACRRSAKLAICDSLGNIVRAISRVIAGRVVPRVITGPVMAGEMARYGIPAGIIAG